MNRPKFRVWSKRRNDWLTDNDHSFHCSSNWMMDIFTGEIIDFTLVGNEYLPDREPTWYMDKVTQINESPFVVQQWTGLKDDNKKDIYEGDIIKISNGERLVADFVDVTVLPEESVIGLLKRSKMGEYYLSNSKKSWYNLLDYESWEVIGNIFENSKLLNTKE